MLLFKLNQLDESLIIDDVYFLSCVTLNDRKYLTSIVGKSFTKDDDNAENIPDVVLSTSLAFLSNPNIVCCTKDMLPIITDLLNKVKTTVCVNSLAVNIITSETQLIIDERLEEVDAYKLQILQKLNKIIKNCIPTSAITSFIKCSVYIQKMILENTITVTYNTQETYKNKKEIVEYLASDIVSEDLKNVILELFENLPIDKLPSLSNISLDTENEENIQLLESYIKDIEKIMFIIKMFYRIINMILHSNDLAELRDYEDKLVLLYYKQIELLV